MGAKPHRVIERAAPYVFLAAAFSAYVLADGIPALRHDWLWPSDRAQYIQRMFDLTSGWSSGGLGYADPYPTPYLVIWPLLVFGAAFGSWGALLALSCAIPCAIFYAARCVGRTADLDDASVLALAALLLFNPWVYNKVVAGHLTMLLAYAGLAIVGAGMSSRDPHRRELTAGLILSALQIQFFLIAFLATCFRQRARAVISSQIVGLVVFLPAIIGLASNVGGLSRRLITIAWENSQSVRLEHSVLLLGYFPRYASEAFSLLPRCGLAVVGVLALVGFAWPFSRSARIAGACTVILLLVASGTTGPIGGAWRWALRNFAPIAVYREMYDIIGAVAIGYALLVSAAIQRWPRLRFALWAAAVPVTAAWVIVPPATQWVPASSIPLTRISSKTERYAVMPPFQPDSYRSQGSGIDPMYVAFAFGSAALNAPLPHYPANVALARFARTGSAAALEAVGVSEVVCRRGMDETIGARNFYRFSSSSGSCRNEITPLRAPSPIVALFGSMRTCSVCDRIDRAQIFFGDKERSAHQAYIKSLPAARTYADPAMGWIDNRLMFEQNPALAQPFGGLFTKSAARLAIPQVPFLLLDVDGTLVGDGRRIASNTRGYRWVSTKGARAVRCLGSCAIALAGDPHGVPANRPAERGVALAHRIILPWWWQFDVPPKAGGDVRVLQRYSVGWIAFNDGGMLEHIRVDGAFNGWRIDPDGRGRRFEMVHVPSLAQLILELLAYIVVGLALFCRHPADNGLH